MRNQNTPSKTTNRARANSAGANRKPPVTQNNELTGPAPGDTMTDPITSVLAASPDALKTAPTAPSHTQSVVQGETPRTESRHKIYLVNPETGRYESKYVDEAPAPVFVGEEEDDINFNATDIQEEWVAKGKGDMQWKWLHTNAKHSENERARGYLPVDPAKFKTNRFMAQNLPGIGMCYVYKDCYLCEIPLHVALARRAASEERARREQREILLGIDEQDAAINEEYDGLLKITRARDLNGTEYDRRNPIQDEVDSIEREVARMQKLTGNPRLHNGIAVGGY